MESSTKLRAPIVASPARGSREFPSVAANSLPLVLALLAPLYYGTVTLHHALAAPYRVQDDMRLHIVWLRAAADHDLFRDDPFAAYFSSLLPMAFRAMYEGVTMAGLDPVLLAKALPLALALVTTALVFAASRRTFGGPAAVVTSLALNQCMWNYDDLASATPRSFVWPFMAAVVYLLARRAWAGAGLAAGALALFYPIAVPVAALFVVVHGARALASARSIRMTARTAVTALFLLVAVGGVALVAAPLIRNDQLFTSDEVAHLPEFGPGGRIAAWTGRSVMAFWLTGSTGLNPRVFGVLALLGVFFPFIRPRVAEHPARALPVDLALAALVMFCAAHLAFPLLFFPDRHTKIPLVLALCLAAGPVGVMAWRRLTAGTRRRRDPRVRTIARVALAAVVIAAIVPPAVPSVFLRRQYWVDAQAGAIHDFLSRTPENTLVASLAEEASNIPAFASRSVFVTREFAWTFHRNQLMLVRARAAALLQAHYTPDAAVLSQFVDRNSIDYFLVSRNAFTESYLRGQRWAAMLEPYGTALATLQGGERPALARALPQCAVETAGPYALVDARCAAERAQ